MKRLKDTYLDTLTTVISLAGKHVLEIGCGTGSRTIQIAGLCEHITALEPDANLVAHARTLNPLSNGEYLEGSAERMPIQNKEFDVVFFTLSFHHVPTASMHQAIDEALRLLAADGHIVFFEPTFNGTFFEAECVFDACDGDERMEKAAAYATMLSHEGIQEIAELFDETVFSFESVTDFIDVMHPSNARTEAMTSFLDKHDYILRAERRINVFKPA